MKRKKDGRKNNGGKRKGAGRKAGKPTTVISFRVPIIDKNKVKMAINTLLNNA